MFDRSIHSYQLTIPTAQRIIAISDIHGNLPVLKKLLKKISYDPRKDELFLVGDLLEKGAYNMDTLHYLMELSRNPHVHPMIGNCDVICRNILYDTRLEFLKSILMDRKNSLLHEMAAELGFRIQEETDMKELSSILRTHYREELEWVDRLPHVIETQDLIFAHAAIHNEDTYGRDMRDIMVYDQFMKGEQQFHKYVIVGHLPVSEYCNQICCFNPIIDHRKKIISIDGGNGVKHAGQLNALLIQNQQFSYTFSDGLDKAEILETIHPQNQDPFFITWHESRVQVLQEEELRSYCHHIASGKDLWIPREFLYKQPDGIGAADYTTYQLPVKKGDKVKVISSYSQASLVKKNGCMGWVPNRILKY